MKYTQSRQMVIDRVVCILRILTILLVIATVLFGRQNKLLIAADMILGVTMLMIWIFLRQYIHEGKEGLFVWQKYCANETDMLLCTMGPFLVLAIRGFLDFEIRDWTRLVGVTLVASVVIGAGLLLVLNPRETRIRICAYVFALLVLCMFGACMQLNFVLDFSEPEMQQCQVVSHEMDETSGRGPDIKTYSCIVVTQAGEELKIPVSKAQYRSFLKGSTVTVTFSEGAFGVAYAYIADQQNPVRPK